MPAQTIVKLATFLAIPLAVLAAPEALTTPPYSVAPFAPATPQQGPFHKCATEEHHTDDYSYPASMLDCLSIGDWARQNNGEWVLKATATDDDDWFVLRKEGNCALLVQNTVPTFIGNKDVTDLIDAIHLGDGIRLGPIEEVGKFGECPNGAGVSFWLRDSKF